LDFLIPAPADEGENPKKKVAGVLRFLIQPVLQILDSLDPMRHCALQLLDHLRTPAHRVWRSQPNRLAGWTLDSLV